MLRKSFLKNSGKYKLLRIILAACLIFASAFISACSGAPDSSASLSPGSPRPSVSAPEITEQPPKPTPAPTSAPTPEVTPEKLPLSGYVIGLDPGHQSKPDSKKEPNSPGSRVMKARCSSGTRGVSSRIYEYVINLQVALKLRDKLVALGAKVVMTREENDARISNVERATLMNDEGVDCWLRIHANGASKASAYGMEMLVPKSGCLDTSDKGIYNSSIKLGETLLDAAAGKSGAKNLGLSYRSDQTGFNWSQRPVCNIEMGYMTNKKEDLLLVSDDYQEKIASGLAEGFLDYFSPQ